MRDYQKVRNNPFVLPNNLYRQTLYLIRDYSRLKEEYQDVLYGSSAEGGRGSMPGDPTGALAIKLENLYSRIRAVEKAKAEIPPEYMTGIWENIISGRGYPKDAARNTYGNWKRKFIWAVARNMKWI